MNKRVKELKKQAWEYAMAVHDGHIVPPLDKEVWPISNVFDEKFAELIVRDVLDEVLQAMDNGMDVYDTVADKFGVEE